MGLIVWGHLSGCATSVIVDYDKAINFADLKTYTLLDKSEKSSDDTRVSSPLIDRRIASAINDTLQSKGFRLASESQDVHVRYQINLQQKIATDNNGVSFGFGTGTRRTGFGVGYSVPSAEVESYEKVMLTIDIINTVTGDLIWRGISARRMTEGVGTTKADAFFKGMVAEIMARFPPP
jgi:hypothetical protein